MTPACRRRAGPSSCDPVTLSSYERAFELVDLGRYTANSLLVAAIAVPLAVLVASWAGFAISQLPPRVSRAVLAPRSWR